MTSIIQEYICLQNREYNLFWLIAIYLIGPTILGLLIWFGYRQNIFSLFEKSGSDIITMLSIINGFLLGSISIVIANTSIDRNEASVRNIQFEKIGRMRKIMMYDILLQILVIIPLCALIIFLKTAKDIGLPSEYILLLGYLVVYLGCLSMTLMCTLAHRFMHYQDYIERR